VLGAHITLTGPGISRRRTTTANGTARFSLKPRRSGILTLTAQRQFGCRETANDQVAVATPKPKPKPSPPVIGSARHSRTMSSLCGPGEASDVEAGLGAGIFITSHPIELAQLRLYRFARLVFGQIFSMMPTDRGLTVQFASRARRDEERTR
jgi:hypothetical protein